MRVRLYPLNTRSSWGSRGLHKAERVLVEHYAWKIGAQSHLLASKHKWVNGTIHLFRDNVPLRTVTSVTIGSLVLLHIQGWNVPHIHSLITPQSALAIRGMEIPLLTNPSDTPYRPFFTASGQYTTKYGYYILSRKHEICSMNPLLVLNFFWILWGVRIMPRWKIFIWKLWHNSIAVSLNLSLWCMATFANCPICTNFVEDWQHLFCLYPIGSGAWRTGQLGINSSTAPYIPFKDWLIAWILYFRQQDGLTGDLLPIFLATL